MQQAWFDYLIILLYLAAVIGIGVYFSRGEKSSENYLLGATCRSWQSASPA